MLDAVNRGMTAHFSDGTGFIRKYEELNLKRLERLVALLTPRVSPDHGPSYSVVAGLNLCHFNIDLSLSLVLFR